MKPRHQKNDQDNWDGEIYSDPRYSRLQHHFEDKIFDKEVVTREGNYPHNKILEVGCGNGYLTGKIQDSFHADVLGVDASESMLKKAKDTYKHNPHIFFQKVDISASDFTLKQEYDAMISFFCFHWIVKQHEALTNVAQALKAGSHGYIFFPGRAHFPNVSSPKKSYIDIAKDIIANDPEFKNIFSDFTIERIKLSGDNFPNFVEHAGLQLEKLLPINETFLFNDVLELSRFYQGILAGYLKFINPENLFKEDKLSYVAKLCDKVANQLLKQGTYKLLSDGRVESEEDFLLAIVKKPELNNKNHVDAETQFANLLQDKIVTKFNSSLLINALTAQKNEQEVEYKSIQGSSMGK